MAGLLLTCVLFLSSCFTTTLWVTHEVDHHPHSISNRIILTPFTLLLDALTWPFQESFWRGYYRC